MYRLRPAAQVVVRSSRGIASFGAIIRRRPFSATATSFTSSPKAQIVSKFEADTEAVAAALDRLLASSGGQGRWALTAAGDGVERSFKFKTFTKTWDFMTAVSLQCKLQNHHPEWSNVFNSTFVRWTTHSPVPGLTRKDVELAAVCDTLARDFGEIVDETAAPATKLSNPASTATRTNTNTASTGLQGLADQITDCGCSTPEKGGKK